jgi:glycosyltransferase involved in cell wall biosynthesis
LNRSIFKRLFGAGRPKIIAVLATTHQEAEDCVAHARTSGSGLPVWVWCAEPGDGRAYGDRLQAAAKPSDAYRELNTVWPALVVVAWSGTRRSVGLKLLPFLLPPFRVVIRNEVNDFFSARSMTMVAHLRRRVRDGVVSLCRRLRDLSASAVVRTSEWIMDVIRLAASFAWRAGDWLSSATLALLARIAPVVWPWVRVAAVKRRRAFHDPIELGSAADLRSAEIPVADRRWRTKDIQKKVEMSEVSFLVFRHPRCTEPAQPLLELAQRTNAFAVAQQSAYTGWREQVTTRHPFRALQEGEKTSVLSPVSPLLVVRREAVQHLGVPRAFTFGAGMAALCRKAAAAGLESYAVGGSLPLTQEPAMALEDLELVLWHDQFAPQKPELRRGNISRCGTGGPGFRGLPRILVVSPYLPFPLSHGGAVRIYNLCRELAGSFDFVLACFREANERVHYDELHKVFREVHVVDIDEKQPDSTVPSQVSEYRNSAMRGLIMTLCHERGIDLLQLEYTQMAEYRDCSGDTPVLLVEHDITFSLHQQLAETSGEESSHREFRLWQDFERRALADVSAVWTMCGADRTLAIANGADPDSTRVIPNGVDLARFQALEKKLTEPVILFVGSFRHLPNLLAFEALRETILPLVRQRVPRVRLHVVAGPEHERAASLAGRSHLLANVPGITIQGFVTDLRPIYRDCDVVAIPLPVSAGTNIKLMEAMACGRAVVSTPVGCNGLALTDGEDLLIREIGPQFADGLATLLEDNVYRDEIASQARLTAEERFGWDRIARDASDSYSQLLRTTCCEPIH